MREDTRCTSSVVTSITALIAVGLVSSSRAQASDVEARFALLIGHSRGGPGQAELQYSHHDVVRIESVLTELGGFRSGAVRRLENPSRGDLDLGLDWLGAVAQEAKASGEDPLIVFYYSGHARASALSLGRQEYPIGRLRDRLQALPVTVRLVILDACQSGRFSEVKGVLPAKEFAVSSIRRLDMQGLAVMASSTGSELSQESSEIGGSFFTHYLSSGLRGAADRDADGRVSLEEAYRYAYDRTVLATAETRVGRQHPTLELEVRGHGQLVVTQPERATSRLSIPPSSARSVLIATEQGQVWAEVDASQEESTEVPLPPGRYILLTRGDEGVQRCAAEVLDGQTVLIETSGCEALETADAHAKSGRPWFQGIGLELGLGYGPSGGGAYTDTLLDFGYTDFNDELDDLIYSVAVSVPLQRYLDVLVDFTKLGAQRFSQTVLAGSDADVDWNAHGVGLHLRAKLPLLSGRLAPYLQGGGGLGWGRTDVRDTIDHHFGWHLGAAIGIRWMVTNSVGGFVQGGWRTAEIIENLIGDVDSSAGARALAGLRLEL